MILGGTPRKRVTLRPRLERSCLLRFRVKFARA